MTVRLEEDDGLTEEVAGLPSNYNFEIRKTLRTIKRQGARRVALQFPDGLLSYAPVIIDAIERHTGADCTVLGDVVYGACCVDDRSVDTDLLIHYGHSCLIPIQEMDTRVLYVFVEIRIDIDHLCSVITDQFTGSVAVIGTIQFNGCVNRLKRLINGRDSTDGTRPLTALVPQVRPLSMGEVLGCTSPVIGGADAVVYIGDGRFHLESAMIQNPGLAFYKYCPFSRRLTREFYDHGRMLETRSRQIRRAMGSDVFGVILGSLGRQGNRRVMENVVGRLERMGKREIYRIVVDEINEEILDRFDYIDAFVQVSCPRLSIDWGGCYRKPLLSPYELYEMARGGGMFHGGEYKMDYYAADGAAPWKNYNDGSYAK